MQGPSSSEHRVFHDHCLPVDSLLRGRFRHRIDSDSRDHFLFGIEAKESYDTP